MPVDLSVKVARLKLKNPIIAASGTFGYGSARLNRSDKQELKDLVNVNEFGGIITKTITLNPRQGNPPPRICETPSGILNSIGLENPGLEYFCKHYLPVLASFNTARIVSVGGEDEAELPIMIKRLANYPEIDALEINLSCPNLDKSKPIISTSPKLVESTINKIRKLTKKPLIAKLSPNVTNIVDIAKSAHAAGADAVSLINTITGMAIDWRKRKPFLGNITGGLSGPCIKPIALRMVWQVASQTRIPVIGIGGISNAEDVMDFLVAGASAVQVGTANIVDPDACIKIINQIPKLLEEQKIKSIREIVNTLKSR